MLPRKQVLRCETKICQKPFLDHTSNKAIAAYLGKRMLPVPDDKKDDFLEPRFSFQVYVTFDMKPEQFPSLAEKFVSYAMSDMTMDYYPVRFDIYTLPGKDAYAVIDHYHSEGRAMHSYDTYGCCDGWVFILSKDTWELEGVDSVTFDETDEWRDLPAEEKEVAKGVKVPEDGVWINGPIPVQHINRQEPGDNLSRCLLNRCYPEWSELEDEYSRAIDAGKTEW